MTDSKEADKPEEAKKSEDAMKDEESTTEEKSESKEMEVEMKDREMKALVAILIQTQMQVDHQVEALRRTWRDPGQGKGIGRFYFSGGQTVR